MPCYILVKLKRILYCANSKINHRILLCQFKGRPFSPDSRLTPCSRIKAPLITWVTLQNLLVSNFHQGRGIAHSHTNMSLRAYNSCIQCVTKKTTLDVCKYFYRPEWSSWSIWSRVLYSDPGINGQAKPAILCLRSNNVCRLLKTKIIFVTEFSKKNIICLHTPMIKYIVSYRKLITSYASRPAISLFKIMVIISNRMFLNTFSSVLRICMYCVLSL